MPEPATKPKPTKKRRGLWWKIPLGGLLLLLLAFAIFRFVVHERVQNRLNAIRDAGYPVTLEELDAWYTYPDGPNAAAVYQQAFDAYVGDEQFERTLPLLGDRVELPGPGEKMPEDVAERVAYYLEQNAEAIALLEEAAQIQGCRYPVNLTNGLYERLPHLSPLHHGIELTRMQIALAIDREDYDAAVDHSITRLALSRSLENEPHILSSMSYVGSALRDMDEVEHLVRSGKIGDPQLEILSQAIASIDIDRAVIRGWVAERCIGDALFIDPIETLDLEPSNKSAVTFAKLWQLSGLWDMDRAYRLGYMQRFVDYAENPVWQTRRERLYDDNVPEIYKISYTLYPSAYDNFRSAQRMKAKQAVILTAITVERYREKYGERPERLDDLIPEYLSEIPGDTIDDQKIQYRTINDGTVIFSFGTDGLDNQGCPFNEEGWEGGNGSDISFIFGPTVEELWPSTSDESDEQLRGGYDDPTTSMGFDFGFLDEDTDKAYTDYLATLEEEGFPRLTKRPLDGVWPSESFDWDFDFEAVPDPTEELESVDEGM